MYADKSNYNNTYLFIYRDMEDEIEFSFVREIDNVEVAVDVSYEPEAKMEDILSEIMDVEDLEIASFEKDDLTLYIGMSESFEFLHHCIVTQ